MDKAYIYQTKIGRILIKENSGCITEVSLLSAQEDNILEDDFISYHQKSELVETHLIKETAMQFGEYLDGGRKVFEIPIRLEGTEFQVKVWEALMMIPYGETRSYRQIAEQIGNTKACRAVGRANHNNPIICIIPCHRVIGTDGKLVGYGGGLPVKEYLLNMEKQNC